MREIPSGSSNPINFIKSIARTSVALLPLTVRYIDSFPQHKLFDGAVIAGRVSQSHRGFWHVNPPEFDLLLESFRLGGRQRWGAIVPGATVLRMRSAVAPTLASLYSKAFAVNCS